MVKLLINEKSQTIKNQIFNVGYQNLSVDRIARIVSKTTSKFKKNNKKLKIIKTKTKDNRSYHINSEKIYKILKFKPKRKIEEAILELLNKFKNKKIPNSFNNVNYFNVKK